MTEPTEPLPGANTYQRSYQDDAAQQALAARVHTSVLPLATAGSESYRACCHCHQVLPTLPTSAIACILLAGTQVHYDRLRTVCKWKCPACGRYTRVVYTEGLHSPLTPAQQQAVIGVRQVEERIYLATTPAEQLELEQEEQYERTTAAG